DEEDSIWAYVDRTAEWYLHHFYSHQPDPNTANPKVRDAIAKTMGFWLQAGVDGFRVHAVRYLMGPAARSDREQPAFSEPQAYLRALRQFLHRRNGSAILLGEVYLPHADQIAFFGGRDGD